MRGADRSRQAGTARPAIELYRRSAAIPGDLGLFTDRALTITGTRLRAQWPINGEAEPCADKKLAPASMIASA